MNRLEFAMKRVCCVVIGQPSWAVCSSTWPNQEQRSNGLYFFVDTSRRNVVWPGHMPVPMAETLNVMQLRFRVQCVWVKVSLVSKYPMEIKVRVPGQTPGLVHNLGGPLVLTDRQDRRHSLWIYNV